MNFLMVELKCNEADNLFSPAERTKLFIIVDSIIFIPKSLAVTHMV